MTLLMSLINKNFYYNFFQKSHTLLKDHKRFNSSMVSEFRKAMSLQDRKTLYWTSLSEPHKHVARHEGLFYTVPHEQFDKWLNKGLLENFYRLTKSLGEASIMIRKPALEIIDSLNKIDSYSTLPKFVLHGRNGCGKSTSLAHVIHYAALKKWILVHIPWAAAFNRYFKDDIQYSSYSKSMRVDQPIAAAQWLSEFKSKNESLIKDLNLKVSKQYIWNKRETTEAGSPLLEVIDLGLTRNKFASDIMGIVLKELSLQATEGKFRLLVAIDGVNALWQNTIIKQEDLRTRKHKAEELTIVHHLGKLIAGNWKNGAIICTVDGNAGMPVDSTRYLPFDLLTKEGFEHIDPFIPIFVDNYTEKEFHNCMQYFINNKWIINPQMDNDNGLKEMKSLSCKNPLELYYLSVLV